VDRHGRALTVRVKGPRARPWLLAAVPLGFFGVFFAYPVGAIVSRGLVEHGPLDLGNLGSVVWFTVWQATVSTVVTVVAGLPAAYVLARFDFPGRRLLHAAVVVPFVLPTVVVGSAFLALGFEPSVLAILCAHAFFNYAVVVRTVTGLWAHLDPRTEEAARVLGASRWQAFRLVTLPALRPAIIAAATIVFLFCFTSFGVILILGGPTRSTLETEIYRQTAVFLHLRTAAVLTLVQLGAVVALLLVTGRALGRDVALRLRAPREVARRPRTPGERFGVAAVVATMVGLLATPVAVLVARSFDTPGGVGFGFYRALGELRRGSVLFVEPLVAVRNSLVIATEATAVAVAVGGIAAFVASRARRRWLEGILALPLGVSAVTVGFGFLIALDRPPLDLRTSSLLVPIAHALVAVPFVVRVTMPVLRSIDPRLRESAAMLGASPARVWREVDLPIMTRALAVAAGFAFAISLGEFGATLFIVRPDRPTLPIVIYRLLSQPGSQSFGAAMAASTILAALTAIVVLAIDRFRVGTAGEW